eukprot:1790252-Prymnesium_polylepis.1
MDWGVVNFTRHRRSARAEFLRVPENADAQQLLRFLQMQWQLPAPGMLLQVIGSAQEFNLPSNMVLPLTEGVVHAGSVANSWIVTGGLDAGVVSLIGNAIARQKH